MCLWIKQVKTQLLKIRLINTSLLRFPQGFAFLTYIYIWRLDILIDILIFQNRKLIEHQTSLGAKTDHKKRKRNQSFLMKSIKN